MIFDKTVHIQNNHTGGIKSNMCMHDYSTFSFRPVCICMLFTNPSSNLNMNYIPIAWKMPLHTEYMQIESYIISSVVRLNQQWYQHIKLSTEHFMPKIIIEMKAKFNISPTGPIEYATEICTWLVLYYVLMWFGPGRFTHISYWHWDNHTVEIIWLPQYQWSKPEEYS